MPARAISTPSDPDGSWRLGYLTYLKQSKSGDCSNISTFVNGTDFTLSRTEYDAANKTMNVLSESKWDDRAGKYLVNSYTYDAVGNRRAMTDTARLAVAHGLRCGADELPGQGPIAPAVDNGATVLITQAGITIRASACRPSPSMPTAKPRPAATTDWVG